MLRSISIAALSAILASSASAQQAQFSGTCTDYSKAGQAACDATQWCRWQVSKKAPTLPNGVPNASCVFKPGHKAGWQTAQQGKQQ